MESKTKNHQDTRTLRAMVERAYGSSQARADDYFAIELTQGLFNAVYRVRLQDGRDVVAKIGPSGTTPVLTYERDLVRNELAAMEVVRNRSAVPIPRVDFVDTSRDICDGDWYFMQYIDAENFGRLLEHGEMPSATSSTLHEMLGTVNKELNAIVGPRFGPITGSGFSSWRDAFLVLITDLLDDAARTRVDLGWDAEAILSVVIAHSRVLGDVLEPRLVHWDLWPSNVMIRDSKIVAVIDHERAVYADPLMEAGFLGDELPIFGDAPAFQRGYGLHVRSDSERTRRRLYSLHMMLVMIIEPSYRGTQDPNQYRWARERLADLLCTLDPRLTPA